MLENTKTELKPGELDYFAGDRMISKSYSVLI